MRRTPSHQAPSGRLKNALQVMWRGPSDWEVEEKRKEGTSPKITDLHGKNIVFHVHRHQQHHGHAKSPMTPPLLRASTLPLLQRPLHMLSRGDLTAAALVPFVPTFPVSVSKIHSLLSSDLQSKLTVPALRNLLKQNFVFFSSIDKEYFALNPLVAKAAGFGAADPRLEADALEEWCRIEKVVQILPLEFARIETVMAAYEDVHRELLEVRFLQSLTDICDFGAASTLVRMKVDVFLPGKGCARTEFILSDLNKLLSVVCAEIPSKFVRLEQVYCHVNREEIKRRGLGYTSMKSIVWSQQCAHALEVDGPFVRLAPTFSHREAGRADAKFTAAHFAAYEAFKASPTNTYSTSTSISTATPNPKKTMQKWTEMIRNLLPVDKLTESLPHTAVQVCTTADEGTAAAQEILAWYQAQQAAEKERGGFTAIGLDLEWSCATRVALLQVALPGRAFLFRLHVAGSPTSLFTHFPAELRLLLADPALLKVGVGVHDDAQRLHVQHDLRLAGCLDVREMMLFSGFPSAACSLQELVHSICKVPLAKDKTITHSNWEEQRLSAVQEAYAANDAVSSLVAGRALARLVPVDTFAGLVDRRDGMSIRLLVRINTIRRIRRMMERIPDDPLRQHVEARLLGLTSFGDMQKLHFKLSARFGPEAPPRGQDELPSVDDLISDAVEFQLAKDARLLSPPVGGAKAPLPLPPLPPRQPPPTRAQPPVGAPAAVPAGPPPPAPQAKPIVLPPEPSPSPSPPPPPPPAAVTPPPPPPPSSTPQAAQAAPVAAVPPPPPPSGGNKLVEQYMLLQQQRTSAFSGMGRPPAAPAAAAAAAAALDAASSDGEEDLEALQREFESQFSHVFAPGGPGAAATAGVAAAPSVISHPSPRMPAAAPTMAAAPPMSAASMALPPAEARAVVPAPFTAAGGFLQPDIPQIPMPPAPAPSKKLRAVDGLPPSTKKWNDRRGEKTEQQELLQRLTSELLSQAVPAGPPIARKMPPQVHAGGGGGAAAADRDATVSINVDHLRMMLEALKDKEK